jgi:PAS domain S-box-containing protein
MNRPAMLADHLDAQTDAIIALWRETFERYGDAAEVEPTSRQDFVDHIPELLDRLARRLRGRPADSALSELQHARLQWRRGYGATEVVNELNHLRKVLVRATFDYAREQGFDLATVESVCRVICDVMNEATTEEVGHFMAVSASETREALTKLGQRQLALEAARTAAETERAKLRTVLENLPVGVWVVDTDGLLLSANREAGRLYPSSEPLIVERTNLFQVRLDPPLLRLDGTPYANDELPLARALGGETIAQEEMLWSVAGDDRILSVNAGPLTSPAGGITGAVAVGQDITENKRAEVRLRHQFDFTSAITNSLGEGVVALDAAGRVTFLNAAAERILGWSDTEILGKCLHDEVHDPRHNGAAHQAHECPLLTGLHTGETARGEETLVRQDGQLVPVAFTSSPIVSEGRVTGLVEVLRDITEQKRLEANLAASEALFRSIAEQSPMIIWRTGPDGLCDYVNKTAIDFHGSDLDQLINMGWTRFLHPDDRESFLRNCRLARELREPYEQTARFMRHDGEYRWITSRGTPFHDDQDRFLGYLGSCLDITPRIELEAALERERELAQASSIHKTRLLSALSHDARTPLNAVVLASQLLEMHCQGIDNPEVADCLRTIKHSVGNVLDLLGDLLNLTKIDAGALPLEVSRFELEPVLAESLSGVEPQARNKGLDAQLETGDLAGAVLETDRSKLKQILCNLLSNAVRYTNQGHIRVVCRRTDDQLLIAVEDTGVGIDPADQQRIFDEFATLSQPGRASNEGTGLGLAICRRLANLLDGEIILKSKPDRGSTFTLVLPGSVLTSTTSSGREASFEPLAPRSGLILVAEDHLTSRQTLAKVLRRLGYRALEASNGRDVLALVRQERPMAVLMDVNMPVMDGIDATLALRADPRFHDLPIFALTGDVSVINQRRIGEAGVSGYLEKPVTWELLKQALASLTP